MVKTTSFFKRKIEKRLGQLDFDSAKQITMTEFNEYLLKLHLQSKYSAQITSGKI